MPNDLIVRPIAPLSPEPAAQESTAAPPERDAASVPATDNALPNPTLRLDPTLGLVVIEFHNQSGHVTTSIPGARQLDAYRTARELAAPLDAVPSVHTPATRTV